MHCNDGGGSLLMILPLMMVGRTKEKQTQYDDKERGDGETRILVVEM